MDINRFPDNIHLFALLLALIAILILFIELGYRVGTGIGGVRVKAQISQVRAIMGASLGLLAFMLAFAFSSGQSHFETRTEGLLYETNVISQAYRIADILEEPVRSQVRGLLRDSVELRAQLGRAGTAGRLDEVGQLIAESERIHQQLWDLATGLNLAGSESQGLEMFTAAVLELMNAQTTRVEAALYNRIPPIIWITLLFMACLSMLTMGYQAGLTGTRSHIATWTLAVAFSAVMILIIDLDRPAMTLFDVNDQIMMDLRARMDADSE